MTTKKNPVIRASELHRAGGKVLKRVVLGHEHVVVERDGYRLCVWEWKPHSRPIGGRDGQDVWAQ